MEKKVFNFNAGPAMLPREVMEKAQREFIDYDGTGMSIMEMSHRGKIFQDILDRAESNLRFLLNIPSDYSVAFFPGGATLQFSAVPLNFLGNSEEASYALTGVWTVKAEKEARSLGYKTKIVHDSKENGYTEVPKIQSLEVGALSKYLYITSNNTIYGTRYSEFPKISFPIVADMTSELLSRKIPISHFGFIFAGAQKNIGPSGLTLGIIHRDFLAHTPSRVPILLNYKNYFENKSLYNTPPTYSIYIAGLVFEWCIEQGGIDVIQKNNELKAELLYDYLDSSKFYTAPVKGEHRSIMNVVFHLKDKALEKNFIEESESKGLFGLQGHRDAGGMRASIYNAMPLEGVKVLIAFLEEFKQRHSK
jgi:phosphoserine aminotransferase